MKCRSWMTVIAVSACTLLGCGRSPEGVTSSSETAADRQDVGLTTLSASDVYSSAPSASQSPAHIVTQFYEALRAGDETRISQLLTDRARHETAKSGLDIRSQGSSSLTFQIGETDYVTEQMDGSHVRTVWTETGENGENLSSEVIWVLRKQHNGWRIAGMATPVMEGQLPLLFNFEDPEDMLRKKRYAENGMNHQPQQSDVQQAVHTADLPQPTNRPH